MVPVQKLAHLNTRSLLANGDGYALENPLGGCSQLLILGWRYQRAMEYTYLRHLDTCLPPDGRFTLEGVWPNSPRTYCRKYDPRNTKILIVSF